MENWHEASLSVWVNSAEMTQVGQMPDYNAFWLIDMKPLSTTQSEGQI